MKEKMSNELRQAFNAAKDEALRCKDSKLRLEHVLYGIMTTENIIHEILNDKVSDFQLLLQDIENFNRRQSDGDSDINEESILHFDITLQEVVMQCAKSKKKEEYISPELFFLTSLDLNMAIIKIIKDYNISRPFIERRLKQLNVTNMYFDEDESNKKGSAKESGTNKQKSKTPILDNFSRDLTVLANEGELDPIIGREAEVERVAQILSRRKKNNPVLIGDPGVGKCYIKETNICLRNDLTGEIFSISVNGFLTSLTNAK